MNPFDQALHLVTDTLSTRGVDKRERASTDSLRRLVEAVGASGSTGPTRSPKPAPAPAPVAPAPAAVVTPPPVVREERVSAMGLAAQVRARLEQNAPAPTASRQATPSPEEAMEALRIRVMAALPNEPLAHNRSKFVFGIGNPKAELMFVGEAPGAEEEIAGEPFVGRAGQLLTKMIEAMGFTRQEVYIANILKWRPDMPEGEPGNRKPRPDEMAACLPYLIEQIGIIQPKCIVALGATAMEGLIGTTEPMRSLRGRWHAFQGIPLMATYHPAYLLRNQTITEKRKVWEDMLQVLELLGRPISAKQRGYFLQK